MNISQFVSKWRKSKLTERSGLQEHFIDLCHVFDHQTPAEADSVGGTFTFEREVAKANGRRGRADVWKRDFFAWEYKSKHKDLDDAHDQLRQYREALLNPPLLAACDMADFDIRTNFTRKPTKRYAFPLEELGSTENRKVVEYLFHDPDKLEPEQDVETITRKAAGDLAAIAIGMRRRGLDPSEVAKFLDRVVFCLFAQDVRLLDNHVFTKIVEKTHRDPRWISREIFNLFAAMNTGGECVLEKIPHFNGDLFAEVRPMELESAEIQAIYKVARQNWGEIDASIIGTLFERGMDPTKEAEIGTHYTGREDISAIVDPVVMAPLRREWGQVREKTDDLLDKFELHASSHKMRLRSPKKDSANLRKARSLIRDFLQRLQEVTILDPACGSGNFLFISLQKLKDLEKEVLVYATERNIDGFLPMVGPSQLRGIEKSPYAYDLARMTIWIGWLQWTKANGYKVDWKPILGSSLQNIRNEDAILDLSSPDNPKEPEWPEAEFVVGNPPFLGNKRMRSVLGEDYCRSLWKLYGDRIPATVDLCGYWFEKARATIEFGKTNAAGLLATTGIKQVGSRCVLDRIESSSRIFFAISDRDWVLDGASVRICMLGFGHPKEVSSAILDGRQVPIIRADLRSGGDALRPRRLAGNLGLSFMGVTKVGAFDIGETQARVYLDDPNPGGRPNSDVLRPFRNGSDMVRVNSGRWIIDFGVNKSAEISALYAGPFDHLVKHVRPERQKNGRIAYREKWWIHGESRPGFRKAVQPVARYIATARVAKHRIFTWIDSVILPDSKIIAVAREDEYSFGVLQSRIHQVWTNMNCGWHGGERGTYNPTTCFETFPFPEPFSALEGAISDAARDLDIARSTWLNPHEWTREDILEFPGSTDGPWGRMVHDSDGRGIGTVHYARRVAKDAGCAKKLAERTLTKLYNDRPSWLDLAHRRLDEAVFAAYGWKPDLSDSEILSRLLSLNLERASEEDKVSVREAPGHEVSFQV